MVGERAHDKEINTLSCELVYFQTVYQQKSETLRENTEQISCPAVHDACDAHVWYTSCSYWSKCDCRSETKSNFTNVKQWREERKKR